MKITPVIAAIAAISALAGCDRLPPPAPDISICWAPSTKDSVASLFQSQAVDLVVDAVNEGATEAQKKNLPSKDDLKQRVTVALDLIHAVNADPAVGSLTCGGNITIKVQRPDGKVLSTSGSSPDFRIYKGEKGLVFSVPGPIVLKALMDKME